MKKVNPGFLFPLLALVILIVALSLQMFNVSPLGKLLDPFIGAVQNGEDTGSSVADLVDGKLPVHDSVGIYFDKRKVPHIYARNTEDLYFAQGYVTAYFRLWQMDFLSYASAGRLSEIFSTGYLDYDRNQRRMGILEAAKESLKLIEKTPQMNMILTAYTRGVNSYIRQLTYKRMPLEYKLLDYEPEPWSNLKSVLIMKYMANTLSGYDEDLSLTNMMLVLGDKDFNRLFPDSSLPFLKKPDYLNYRFLSSSPVISANPYNPRLGSNSWAVSGKKTTSGFPILCSDPHLNLGLPSIWIEMQLSAPDVNAYGVSIPGTPALIIGFNENVAWGITNGADDVKDWYKLKITDDYKKYEFDGKWLDVSYTIEEIKRKGQKPLADTIYHTLQGPIVSDKSFPGRHPELINCALKWELHHPSDEFLCFVKLNAARNYEDYRKAISYYSCPTQNFTFACRDNTIAMNHQGNMAVKWPGEGKFVLDGTKAAHIYTRYIPEDSLPHTLNPACNYVVSANQRPAAPDYPYYYNGYFSETRAKRIQQLLESDDKFDVQKMEAIQMDNVNSFAVDALPVLLRNLDSAKMTIELKEAARLLKNWKGAYDFNDKNAKLFDLWWGNIKTYTWDEFRQFPLPSKEPGDYVLLNLIQKDPANPYFDLQGTSETEAAGDIVYKAFVRAFDTYDHLRKEKSVEWGKLNRVSIKHLASIDAFSRLSLPSSGNPDAINAMSANWGPSWRMVVALGDKPEAYGIYAGGQSGSIGSPYYDSFVDDWTKGRYYPLLFFMSGEDAKKQAVTTWLWKTR